LTYSELVEKAKEIHPSKPAVQNAVAVSTGRKLDVVRAFTDKHELFDWTCVIISKETGGCGIGLRNSSIRSSPARGFFAFDWSAVSIDFDGYIQHAETAFTPKKRIKRPDALKAISQHCIQHKSQLPPSITTQRGLIIELLMDGFTPAEAFAQAVASATWPSGPGRVLASVSSALLAAH